MPRVLPLRCNRKFEYLKYSMQEIRWFCVGVCRSQKILYALLDLQNIYSKLSQTGLLTATEICFSTGQKVKNTKSICQDHLDFSQGCSENYSLLPSKILVISRNLWCSLFWLYHCNPGFHHRTLLIQSVSKCPSYSDIGHHNSLL